MPEREYVGTSTHQGKSTPVRVLMCVVLALGACSFSGAQERRQMDTLGPMVTKLAKMMESYIRYGPPRAGASEQELFAEGTRDDPTLLNQFSQYKLKLLSHDRHAVVLVCTRDGRQALLEDAGCTADIEAPHWKTRSACEFTVNVSQVCRGR
jgi:hypothetical protein